MPKLFTAATCGLVLAVTLAQASAAAPTRAGVCADSPQAVLTVCVAADARGAYYEVYRGERQVITHARLGLVLDGFGNDPASRVANARRNAVDQRWEQPWGEQRVITDRHTELRVTLSGADAKRTEPFDLTVRVFDDGKKTYIQISQAAKNREAPVLVVIGPDGKQEMVNYRVKEDLYIVDRLFERAALVLGSGKKARKVEIQRDGKN